jgi:hypothetical protein
MDQQHSSKRLSNLTVNETDSTIHIQGSTFEGVVFKENFVWQLRNVDRKVPILRAVPVEYSTGWTPSLDHIMAIETAFTRYWKEALNDSLALANHKTVIPFKEIHMLARQYVGFIDSTNTKYVWVNLLERESLTSEWRNEPIIIEDGGYYKRSIIYNAETDSIVRILVY